MAMSSSKLNSATQLAKETQQKAEKAVNEGITKMNSNKYISQIPTQIPEMKFLDTVSLSAGLSIFSTLTVFFLSSIVKEGENKLVRILAFIPFMSGICAICCPILVIAGRFFKLQVLVFPTVMAFGFKIVTILFIILIQIFKLTVFRSIIFISYMSTLVMLDAFYFRSLTLMISRMQSDDYDDNCERIVRSIANEV